jgi:hypothetical protein
LQQTKDQKQIVAMAAQIQSLEKGKLTTMKKVEAKKGSNKKSGSRKFNKNNKKNSNSKYAWLYEAPKPGQPKDKDIKGIKWHWCPHHGEAGKWVKHTLANCKVRKEKEEGKGNLKPKEKLSDTASASASAMQVAGMVAVYPEDDDF